MENRIKYIDTAKGVLIILMLVGHIWNSGVIHDFIYTFHMPAFFIISGMLFCYSSSLKKTLGKVVIAKVKALLIPYFFFESFAIVLQILQYGMMMNIKGYIYEMLSLHLFNGPLWFLWVMFFSEILFFIWHKMCGEYKSTVGYICVVVLVIILQFLPKYQAYINITTTIMAFFFLLVGYLFYNFFNQQSVLLEIVALLLTVGISLVNKGVGMPDYQNGNKVLYIIGAFAGTYFILQFSKLIKIEGIEFYGKNSLILLGTHYPILRLIKKCFYIEEFSVIKGSIFLIVLLVIEIPVICIIKYFCAQIKKYMKTER